MFQRVNFSDFRQAFHKHDRGNQFSCEGLKALFNHLEEVEQDTGEEMELDVIALCCAFSEYGTFEEFRHDYPAVDTMEELKELIPVMEFDGGFLIQAF